MQRTYEAIKEQLSLPPLVHIIGTNGKGTTGRFLAGMLHLAGKRVGHYTSPHILRFNERIWVNGAYIDDERLELLHERLQTLLPKAMSQELSYFEYTTLLAAIAFEGLDIAVMEAGLGGEYDATSVFANILTLVTPIDYDHQAFLGESIAEIAATKLRAVQKTAIIGYQIHPEVYDVADRLGIPFTRVGHPSKELEQLCEKEGLASFFASNLLLAAAGAKRLGVAADLQAALRYRLPARSQRAGNVILDVGHNPLAARALAGVIDKETILVYNTYADKDYKKILEIFAPKIAQVQILPIQNERIVAQEELIATLEEMGVPYSFFKKIEPDRGYLVFGSFSVVEEFVKRCGLDITNI